MFNARKALQLSATRRTNTGFRPVTSSNTDFDLPRGRPKANAGSGLGERRTAKARIGRATTPPNPRGGLKTEGGPWGRPAFFIALVTARFGSASRRALDRLMVIAEPQHLWCGRPIEVANP